MKGFQLAPALTQAHEGLATTDLHICMPYLVALCDLMVAWQDIDHQLLMPHITVQSWKKTDVSALQDFEQMVATTYKAAFYQIFS
jgi:hypothetical protein